MRIVMEFDVKSKVHYMPGKTPLVGWIKGYMVPELLGIEVDRIAAL